MKASIITAKEARELQDAYRVTESHRVAIAEAIRLKAAKGRGAICDDDFDDQPTKTAFVALFKQNDGPAYELRQEMESKGFRFKTRNKLYACGDSYVVFWCENYPQGA